ncbi:LRR receptor-like serine/threonine-protein kinase GSO1 [Tripterygium wilfordii]|uniref:non-specific serine/threonine protein kinase n=2 Tax=Tripterygium wilfordii TaxID=458696 RepID=A0A7J7CHP7_TRIWF|nr:LRR receptor-like serine/threonine-protein kinase GSO1 [Tripterygium wilfordii]
MEFGSMSQLVSLFITNNNLSGVIPRNICSNNSNLEHLILSEIQLYGEIPRELSQCKSLKQLDLSNNTLNGSIPIELYQLLNLKDLFLHNNSLVGSISPFIANLSNLEALALYHNNLQGNLPREIGMLSKLEILYLYDNQLSGEIPKEIGNCSNLEMIDFYGNRFNGKIPDSIGMLKGLNFLHLRQNELVGDIPASLGNCHKLTILDLADNCLSGGIPATFGSLQVLEQFMLYNNSLEGNLPDSLVNLANLMRINLSKNRLNGSIAALCHSHSFLSFDVTSNAFDHEIPPQLGNSSTLERLRLGKNRFTGKIPWTLGKLHELSLLDVSGNLLTGPIPAELVLCKKLTHIDLNNNFLSGPIPWWLGSLPLLGELKLSSNHFVGSLPLELFNCSKLLVLSLDGNSLNGTLPSEIGMLPSLNVLNLNQNNLSGPIPPAIGKLSKLYELGLSRNNFNGEIPFELGQLKNLQTILDLSYNNLSGKISLTLGALSKLEELDLSHNQLTGDVPPELSDLSSLGKLNLSYNNLEGKLGKQFSHWPPEAFEGNSRLCGSPLDHCNDIGSKKQRSSLSESLVVAISAVSTLVVIAVLILGAILLKRQREFMKRAKEVNCAYSSSSSQAQRRLLFPNGAGKRDYRWEDIMEATNGLNDEFIIGSGGSGKIYRAEFSTGETFAVKRILWKDDFLLNKSFAREVTTLGRIRHRHLVKLMGYCSNRGAGSNLLIYQYMENGSVWDWLHQKTVDNKKKKCLDLEARLKIAVGLAHGVEYLHHDCVPKIVHRDIKSSNVLVDSNMEAHLGDFGLAKAIAEDHDDSYTESSAWFAGSYGYIAPEYAYSLKATEMSDVYSMGIVLMELVSGKMPTDASFGVEMDMVRWVDKGIETQGSAREELIDPALKPLLPDEEFAAYQVLEIALQCTRTVPQERPSSRQACDQVLHIFNNRVVGSGKNNMDTHV